MEPDDLEAPGAVVHLEDGHEPWAELRARAPAGSSAPLRLDPPPAAGAHRRPAVGGEAAGRLAAEDAGAGGLVTIRGLGNR